LSIRKEEGNDCVPFLLIHYTGCKFNGFILFLPKKLFKLTTRFNRVFEEAVLILFFMNVLVEVILVYLLYRFIAGFLVPLFRTTRTMRQQFQDMNARSHGPEANRNPPSPGPQGQPGPSGNGSSKVGEYIDFEEVK
jgi:hypothetical protein